MNTIELINAIVKAARNQDLSKLDSLYDYVNDLLITNEERSGLIELIELITEQLEMVMMD